VAKVNQVKLRQDADAHEKAGRFDKAIDALKQIVSDNARDWNTVNRIGDLYAKLNNAKAANEQYVKVARYFADDGFYLKAIAVWKKVLRNDASLLEGHVSLGDLYARQGLVAEAKQTFGLVYDEFVKRNKLRDAGEVLRRMAEVDPSDMKVRIRLAELYVREGSAEKAAGEYGAIADELVKKGLLSEALQLLDKALRSVPRSPRLLSAAARVHMVQKDFAKAVDLLDEARRASPGDREVALRLAEASLGARRGAEARRVLEELLAKDPADLEARQQLGQVWIVEGRYDEAFDQLLPAVERLVERRQVDRAAALLQQVVQKNPAHIRSLARLVELYRQSRNEVLVAQTYSQMVEAYLAGGGLDQAASILEMLVQLEPHNEQHRGKLRWLREQQGHPGGGAGEPRPSPPPTPPLPPAPPPGPARAGGIELSGPLSAEDQEFIGEHLAEGRVFRKYGLGDKARDQFEAVLARFPDNVEALQDLVDLHREKGESEAAARRLRVLAEVFRLKGEATHAARADEEADRLVPPPPVPLPAPPPEAPIAAPPPPEPPPATPKAAPLEAAAPEADLDIPIEEAEEPKIDEWVEDLEPAPPAAEGDLPAFDLEDEAPRGEIRTSFIEEEPTPLEAEPPPVVEDGFDLGEPELVEEPEPAAAAPVMTTELRLPAAAPAPARGLPAELARGLEEVSSYVSMGFVEDARGIVQDLAARWAGHPALVERLAQLGLDASEPAPAGGAAEDLVLTDVPSPEPVPAGSGAAPDDEPLSLGSDFLFGGPPPPDEPEDELAALSDVGPAPGASVEEPAAAPGFDLASELGDLFSAQPAVAAEPAPLAGTDLGDAALADIFREFQKGVDKQLGKEDYETRYNLGIAYKEMGLVDEAIAEFQLAAKDESRLLECASMLGICFLEKGMPKLAVKWLEKGLSATGRSDEEYLHLRYDLASALEQAGEPDRALVLFTELFGQDASFRDVAERVRQLGASR
jgi:tetratricopeptide (TPR) repeat protein